MNYRDKTVPCRDCGGAFTFTAGEQEFYAQKGFMNEPTRCPAGRRARKHGSGGAGDVGDGRTPCPYDAAGTGTPPSFTDLPPRSDSRRGPGDRAPRGDGWARRADSIERERPAYSGPLPQGTVLGSVVRVDGNNRFLFVQVDEPCVDVYVHSTLFRHLRYPPRPGDRVRISVEASDRGPRAASFEVAE